MSSTKAAAAPESGTTPPDTPTFEELAADPERRKPMRQFDLKHGPWPARNPLAPSGGEGRERGIGWEALLEQGEEQERAAREWLRHLEAGRFKRSTESSDA